MTPSTSKKKLTPPQQQLLQIIAEAGRYGHFIGRGEQQKIRLASKLVAMGYVRKEWGHMGSTYTTILSETEPTS